MNLKATYGYLSLLNRALIALVVCVVSVGAFVFFPLTSGAVSDRFSGRWVMFQELNTVAEIPVVGSIVTRTDVVVLYDLSFREGLLSGEGTLCKLQIDNGTSLVKTIIPERFKVSLPKPKLSAAFRRENERWIFHQPKQYLVVGARLQNILKDSLPENPSDPRVVDQDNDGKPGVTIRISGIITGEIYVTQRNWTELDGVLKAPGRIEGAALFGNEQKILGATSRYLTGKPDSKPDPKNSRFFLLRVSKNTSCNQALATFGLQ